MRILIAAVIAASIAMATTAPPAHAAAVTYYVDGKLGNDANDGLAPSRPFKTISRAAAKLPAGSLAAGSRVIVVGYPDYVYRERPIPPGWSSSGVQGSPVTFQASGYVAGASTPYVKPIVSGAVAAPLPGATWQTTSSPGVWRTHWTETPFDYGKTTGNLTTAVFQDTTRWLWEQPSMSVLASRAAAGLGGYLYDAAAQTLYVAPIPGGGSGSPVGHTFDVVVRNTFFFAGSSGVRWVEVRGFEVRHSANGIAFARGTDYGTAVDNRVIGNLYMGIQTVGLQTAQGPDPAVGNVIWRNVLSYNTVQGVKVDQGSQGTSVCYNDASANALQGIKVQGPPSGSTYTGSTSGTNVCRNSLHDNLFNPSGSVYTNTSGLTIANGAQSTTVTNNRIWRNRVGILVTQEARGTAAVDKLSMSWNELSSNVRYGLYFLDGLYGTGAGSATSTHDTIWGNGGGVFVERGSTNKRLVWATVHNNTADGIKVGGYQVAVASLAVERSLITSNGGYGLWLVTGNTGTLKYVGLSGNRLGSLKGTPTKTAVNTQAPGYLSTTPGASSFLKLSTTSYQYTAGPDKTAIGARY